MAKIQNHVVSSLPKDVVIDIVRRLCLKQGNFTENNGQFVIKEGENGWEGFGIVTGGGGFSAYTASQSWPATVTLQVNDDGSVDALTYVFGIGANSTHCQNVAGKIKGGLVIAFEDYQEKSQEKKAASQPSKSIPEQILEYKSLLDQGIISAEEFEAKKKELLGK